MPLFTILIPTYNRGHLIAQTLDSVFAQPRDDVEVIVVDDGSTDDTQGVMRRYQERATYLRQPNRGPGAARNLGIAQATGEYVVFLDSDDLQFSWTLANFANAIAIGNRPAAIGSRELNFVDAKKLAEVPATLLKISRYADLYAFYVETAPTTFPTGAICVRADVLRAVNGFPGEKNVLCEDIDLWLRIGDRPGFTMIENPPSYGLRRHSDNTSGDPTLGARGLVDVIANERGGRYPGGIARQRSRLELISFVGRAIAIHCAMKGEHVWAWRTYRSLFAWHVRLGRVRFLAGLPIAMAAFWLQRLTRRRAAAETNVRG